MNTEKEKCTVTRTPAPIHCTLPCDSCVLLMQWNPLTWKIISYNAAKWHSYVTRDALINLTGSLCDPEFIWVHIIFRSELSMRNRPNYKMDVNQKC